jgi:hypothetical protein
LLATLAALAADALIVAPLARASAEDKIRMEEGLRPSSRRFLWEEGEETEQRTALDDECDAIEQKMRSSQWTTKDEVYWLWNTDMGLIWRVWKELRGLGNYQNEFPGRRQVAALPGKTYQIMIDCCTGEFIR